ncbi:hypothetical protein BT93_E0671 [Corymbia citriodora subsp. variegata]|nr:hypothetical protein BT93_E0671 [Corymbia citriodora subsp. variegata]
MYLHLDKAKVTACITEALALQFGNCNNKEKTVVSNLADSDTKARICLPNSADSTDWKNPKAPNLADPPCYKLQGYSRDFQQPPQKFNAIEKSSTPLQTSVRLVIMFPDLIPPSLS